MGYRMELREKILKLEKLNMEGALKVERFYNIIEECELLKANYNEYMTTVPIDCDRELLRLPMANYDLCCALLTMLIREDHFINGSFERRQKNGQVKLIIERILNILSSMDVPRVHAFSEKALSTLDGHYVYALVDPRDEKVFYIGKGIENRVFSHEIESGKSQQSEKQKLQKINPIFRKTDLY